MDTLAACTSLYVALLLLMRPLESMRLGLTEEEAMVKMIVAIMIVVVTFGAAYAGPKAQHISTMKAQCSTDVKNKGLTGQAAKAEFKKCWAGGGEVAH
jgi:hypothetical protein